MSVKKRPSDPPPRVDSGPPSGVCAGSTGTSPHGAGWDQARVQLPADGTADAPRWCGHCGRTSHGMACCGMLAGEAREVCAIDHGTGDEPNPTRSTPVRHGPTPPRRPARRIDPRGNR